MTEDSTRHDLTALLDTRARTALGVPRSPCERAFTFFLLVQTLRVSQEETEIFLVFVCIYAWPSWFLSLFTIFDHPLFNCNWFLCCRQL